MFQKFKDKLHINSPGRRSPSPNARNAEDGSTGWDTLLSATQITLGIAKESVAGLPVPGLEAAIGGLLKVLTLYQGMKANEQAIAAFNSAIIRLNDNVIAPLKVAISKQPDFIDDDIQKRLELLAKNLQDLTKRADAMLAREKPKKFLSSQDDPGVIQELNRELDRIVMAFTGRGSISAEMEARAARRHAQTLVIDRLPRAQARYDSASRVGAYPCFQGTRKSILQDISAWIDDPSSPPIFWLSGMAGIGKSTIAHTIAEQEDKKHQLGASFFFSRDEVDRRNPHLVYPTIAFQLAGFDNSVRDSITQALEQDPDIGHAMMQKQFEQLIARPLEKFKGGAKTILFVLDALDECTPTSGAIEIMARWALGLPKISKQVGVMLKALITSRPELHIHDEFNSSSLRLISRSFVLHDIEKSVVNADIQLYLTARLADLAIRRRVAQPWPTVAEISSLASSSDSLFIFASTTVNFIGGAKSGRSLQHRLDQSLRPDLGQKTSPFAQLDALYLHVLETAENDLEETLPHSTETFRLVLETIVLLLDPLPPKSLAVLLSLDPDDVLTSIQDLRSVLVIPADSDAAEAIRFFHPSFYDFITTPGRGSGRFFIKRADGHASLASLCLKAMHTLLRKDPCSIGDLWSLNSDVADLQGRLDGAAPDHLRYSCRFFCSHISLCEPGDRSLEQLLDSFCESNLLMWLEMMSLLGDIDGAINSIQLLKTWSHKSSTVKRHTADLIYDAYRVLLQYQSPLRLSAGHVYTAVLSFSPVCSLTKHYASQLHVPYVVRGQPARWDANLITTDTQRTVLALEFFPDGKRIATGDSHGQISVWSSSTGAEIISTDALDTHVSACSLDISADGTRIASSIRFEESTQLNIWDAITGSRIFRLGDLGTFQGDTLIAFLPNGLELLCWSTDGTFSRWDSITGSMLSRHEVPVKGSFKISVSRCGSLIVTQYREALKAWNASEVLTIWEVREDGVMSPLQALLPCVDDLGETKGLFIIDRSLLLIVTYVFLFADGSHTTAKLWDYQKGLEITRMTFPGSLECVKICRETKRMAIATKELPMQIWDIQSGTLLAHFGGDGSAVIHAAFSPTEMVVASVDNSGILRTWDIGPMHSGSNSNALETASQPCTSVSASRSGKNVVSAYSGTTVLLWNIAEQTAVKLDVPKLYRHVMMSPDGLYFICTTSQINSAVSMGWALYETKSLQCLYRWPTLHRRFMSPYATFSPDSGRIAVTVWATEPEDHETIQIFDIHHRKILWKAELKREVRGIAFLPQGTSLAVVYEDGYEIFNALPVSAGESEFSADWKSGSEFGSYSILGGILPHADGTQFLLINGYCAVSTTPYLVNMKGPPQITKCTESSQFLQIIETHNGYEPVFLEHDQMGNLYKKGIDSRELLCWLPPAWRFKNGEVPAVWEGSYLIVGLANGEIGVIDVDALSYN